MNSLVSLEMPRFYNYLNACFKPGFLREDRTTSSSCPYPRSSGRDEAAELKTNQWKDFSQTVLIRFFDMILSEPL